MAIGFGSAVVDDKSEDFSLVDPWLPVDRKNQLPCEEMNSTDDFFVREDAAAMTPGSRLLRNRVHAYLETNVLSCEKQLAVLELGFCGANAVFLGRLGHRVVSTSVCEGAFDGARAQVEEESLTDRVVFRRFDVRTDPGLEFAGAFDLVLGDFGVLNTLEPRELRHLAVMATTWVRKGGRAVFVVMPHVCVWETADNVLHGRWKNAGSRSAASLPLHGLHDSPSTRWYHEPAALRTAFSPAFEIRRLEPLGLILPPYGRSSPVAGRAPVLTLLSAVERVARVVPGLARFSDHYLVDLQRSGAVTIASHSTQTAPLSPRLATETLGRTVSRSAEG